MQNSIDSTHKLPFSMNYDFHLGGVIIENNKVIAERVFNEDELVFAGHFPNNKILPGVMLIEFALYLGEEYLRDTKDDRKLSEVLSSRFLAPVLPGMKVLCQCEFTVDKESNILSMKAAISHGEKICARVKARYARSQQ